MKRDHINYFAAGLFTLAALAALMVALYRVTGRVGESVPYYVYYDNIAGLGSGSLVTYEGFQVGYVSRVAPQQGENGTRYRLELRIRKDWKIPVDSVARIYASGLLSDTVINIEEGEERSFVAAGGAIEGAPNADLFAVMGSLAGELGALARDTVQPLLQNLDDRITGLGGELGDRLPAILDDVKAMTASLQRSAGRLENILDEDTERTADRIAANAEEISDNLVQLSRDLRRAQAELQGLVRDARHLMDDNSQDVQRAIRGLRLTVESMSGALDTILFDMEGASRNMNEFTRTIRANPAALITGRPAGTAMEEPK